MPAFNSSFALTAEQIQRANLSDAQATNLNQIINFDRSQLANGGPYQDAFYTLPPLSNNATTPPPPPGTLLKAQAFTDPTPFSLPANTALSRILYATTDINGTVVPTSAFILWPFQPRRQPSSSGAAAAAQTVVWAHGTSGFTPLNAPSAHRALWYGDSGPFALAQAGYAVVAPDYAGLGVGASWDGIPIAHQYLVLPAGARDSLYALRAARAAFPGSLGDAFAVAGHSQGGGVAWSVAELLATAPGSNPGENSDNDEFADLRAGFLGSVAGSPTTDMSGGLGDLVVPRVALMLKSIFPDFDPAAWLTPLGVARLALFGAIEGGISASLQLFPTDAGEQLFKPDYADTWYVNAYVNIAKAGRRPLGGPVLVVQGTEDPGVFYNVTAATVRDTCAQYPESDIEFLVGNGMHHVASFDATRYMWLKWIESRFEGKPLEKSGCTRTEVDSFLPLEQYLTTSHSFPQWAGTTEWSYEVPLGI
ncbi:hypothetical protein SLS62_001265 [Diatrype stigma]|uniref:Secretory lipase n=1 Tax=Diatrype stigma TaxID=117547 RepID=A0AAN9V2C4_9PEZI